MTPGTAVFSAHGHLGSPATVTASFRPALWSCVVFAALAAMTAAPRRARTKTHATGIPPPDSPSRTERTMPAILHRITINAPRGRAHDLISATNGAPAAATRRPAQ